MKKEPIPFSIDLYKKLVLTEKATVITRHGEPVVKVYLEYYEDEDEYPIVYYEEQVYAFDTEANKFQSSNGSDLYIALNAPKVIGYINVSPTGGGRVYPTREMAEKGVRENQLGLVEVTDHMVDPDIYNSIPVRDWLSFSVWRYKSYVAKKHATIMTGNGNPVRILCMDRKGDQRPIVGLITQKDGSEEVATWRSNGGFKPAGRSLEHDIIIKLNELKQLGYLDISHLGVSGWYPTREEAEMINSKSRIGIIEVTEDMIIPTNK